MSNVKPRVPAIPRPSASKKVKNLHKKFGKGQTLMEFVRTFENKEYKQLFEDWMFNKRANFSKPPLGIGNTKRKKGGKKQAAAKTEGTKPTNK